MSRKMPLLLSATFTLLMAACAVAQDAPPAPPAGGDGAAGGGRGNRGGDWRQRMNDQLKKDLGATDDEWKVLQPRIEKVMTAQRQSRGGMFGGFGRGGRGGQPGAQPGGDGAAAAPQQSAVEKANADLRKVLENKDAKAEDIKAALQALREARAKAKAEVEAAQKELREVVSVRQEAMLVSRGILE